MEINLTPEEARVIGCLMEKSVVTPDQYPLTLNALTNACNQKSSRDPVMNMTPGDVQRALRQLESNYLISVREGARAGVEKYTQRLCNTMMAKFHFEPPEFAIITLLLLRGPQTPGELRTRSGRLHEFADNQEVVEALQRLIDWEHGAVVARLPRRAGRQDHEYMHLFSGEIDSAPLEAAASSDRGHSSSRIDQLEARVAALEASLHTLAERLGETLP